MQAHIAGLARKEFGLAEGCNQPRVHGGLHAQPSRQDKAGPQFLLTEGERRRQTGSHGGSGAMARD
jgi:hypothetical protein